MATLPARYSIFWLRFKLRALLRPYVSLTPVTMNVRWRLERTGCGFILWGGGWRRHYSWRPMQDGPCNYATWYWLHVEARHG